MLKAAPEPAYSVPTLAKAKGIGEDKIRAAIHSGELRAVNHAPRGKRPRFYVNASDWSTFENRRSTVGVATTRTPFRARKSCTLKEFF